MNTQNEYVHERAREAAAATGKTQTGAIAEALTRLLADYDIDPEQRRVVAKVDGVRSAVRAYAIAPSDRERAITRIDDLYEERTGLPR